MSSQKYQPQIYQIPSHPSGQLKVVLGYFDKLKSWDFDELNKLSTSDFTQQTFPASLVCRPEPRAKISPFFITSGRR
jgi:hypothetical protein